MWVVLGFRGVLSASCGAFSLHPSSFLLHPSAAIVWGNGIGNWYLVFCELARVTLQQHVVVALARI